MLGACPCPQICAKQQTAVPKDNVIRLVQPGLRRDNEDENPHQIAAPYNEEQYRTVSSPI